MLEKTEIVATREKKTRNKQQDTSREVQSYPEFRKFNYELCLERNPFILQEEENIAKYA
ncbi:unnamed protein product [Linum tenue]|uniref:Uncharacterized protein n=1 Tax=Linum tenue TaxID=586396 RepID=A0AAV0RH49_9ROSI|nr:unnamed protein product [Linum tenue]